MSALLMSFLIGVVVRECVVEFLDDELLEAGGPFDGYERTLGHDPEVELPGIGDGGGEGVLAVADGDFLIRGERGFVDAVGEFFFESGYELHRGFRAGENPAFGDVGVERETGWDLPLFFLDNFCVGAALDGEAFRRFAVLVRDEIRALPVEDEA